MATVIKTQTQISLMKGWEVDQHFYFNKGIKWYVIEGEKGRFYLHSDLVGIFSEKTMREIETKTPIILVDTDRVSLHPIFIED